LLQGVARVAQHPATEPTIRAPDIPLDEAKGEKLWAMLTMRDRF